MVMHGSISQWENRISPLLCFCFFTVCYSLLYHSPRKKMAWWVVNNLEIIIIRFSFLLFHLTIQRFKWRFVRTSKVGDGGESKNDSEKGMNCSTQLVRKRKRLKRWSKFEPRRLLFHHHQLRLSLSKLYQLISPFFLWFWASTPIHVSELNY